MPAVSLRQRFFQLHDAEAVDRFLGEFPWCAIFKAGTSEKNFDAWFVVERLLEPRVDVAVGLIRLPNDRPASDHVAERAAVRHRSPQFLLFERGQVRGYLDELAIDPDRVAAMLHEQLPEETGEPVFNEAAVSLEPYRRLLAAFVAGTLPEERFEWAYVDRLEKDAGWRDEATFDKVNHLFENPWGRDLKAARLVAVEFQAQLDRRREPLRTRAERLLAQLSEPGAGRGATKG
jgi:monothiol bacilliredoxin